MPDYFDSQSTISLQDLDVHRRTCRSCPSLGELTMLRALQVQELLERGLTGRIAIEHKLQAVDFCLVAMEMCSAESEYGDFDAKKELPEEVVLNDKTKVGSQRGTSSRRKHAALTGATRHGW